MLKDAFSSICESISELYPASPVIWDHSVTCHPTQINAPRLNPSQAGPYPIYLVPTPKGWKAELSLVVGHTPRWFTCRQTVTHPCNNHLLATRPRVKLVTS